MAMGDGFLQASGKSGYAWAAYTIDEGGHMGMVEWNANTAYFDAYGNPKTKAQLNADILAELTSQRANQGCAAIPDPALGAVDFFPGMA